MFIFVYVYAIRFYNRKIEINYYYVRLATPNRLRISIRFTNNLDQDRTTGSKLNFFPVIYSFIIMQNLFAVCHTVWAYVPHFGEVGMGGLRLGLGL